MDIAEKRLDEYLDKLTQVELTEQIKKTSQALHSICIKMENAIKKESEVHNSRAKVTTLYANTAKLRDQYIGYMNMLKQMTKKLI
jgi:hypothetical protein